MTQPDKLSIGQLELIIKNLQSTGMHRDIEQQLLDTMRENDRLREALTQIANCENGQGEFICSDGMAEIARDTLKPSKHTICYQPQMDVTHEGLLNIEHLYDPSKTPSTKP